MLYTGLSSKSKKKGKKKNPTENKKETLVELIKSAS